MSEEHFTNSEGSSENEFEFAEAKKSSRGFARMDPAKQREIAKKGGMAAHKSGHAHKFSSDEARAAGKKGGKAVSANREHMAEIGRRGGEARKKKNYLS